MSFSCDAQKGCIGLNFREGGLLDPVKYRPISITTSTSLLKNSRNRFVDKEHTKTEEMGVFALSQFAIPR